jgi:hypothetical protein
MPTTTTPTPAKKSPAKKVLAKPVVKVAVKPAPKAAPKATSKTAPKPVPSKAKVAAKPAAPKAVKVKKLKMVRDSISIPKAEYAVLDALKTRCAALAKPVKKTELLRAGIKVLTSLSDAALLSAVRAVPNLKTGRPANAK